MFLYCVRLPFLLTLACFAIVILFWWSLILDEDDLNSYARCDNCHCIASDGRCPVERMPFLDYSVDTTNLMDFQQPLNAFNLTCNPFTNGTCGTTPKQAYVGDETAVCGIRYVYKNNTGLATCPSSYTLRTYKSSQVAYLDDVSFITHSGPCGVCSTTQDLAALIRTPDMVTASKMCIKKGGVIRASNSYACIRNLGFTPPCAYLWNQYARVTLRDCFTKCLLTDLSDKDFNNPADCKLNKCLQCQKDKEEARFERIAGRTHARSGLLSSVVKPCEDIYPIEHDACPLAPIG